jgi:hypothetical protein
MKPHVALIPMKDHSQAEIPWNLSHEFTREIRQQFMENGELFLLCEEDIEADMAVIGSVDWSSPNLTFTKHFRGTDFVVILELVEHRVSVCDKSAFLLPHFDLVMKMRIRAIDIRKDDPVIVLQEMICRKYPVQLSEGRNFNAVSGDYSETPYGIAHRRLINEIVARLESVLWEAK